MEYGMARPKREASADLIEHELIGEPWVRIKVTHYKIFTSQGRFIAGWIRELPKAEAEDFIAKGQAVAV
jgi:hypothetical protein